MSNNNTNSPTYTVLYDGVLYVYSAGSLHVDDLLDHARRSGRITFNECEFAKLLYRLVRSIDIMLLDRVIMRIIKEE